MPDILSSLVEVVVFRFAGDRPEYLLLQRAAREKLYPSLWQVVTGGVVGEERAQDAALRELREETGLVPSLFWCAPVTDVFYDVRNNAMQLAPVFAAQVGALSVVRLSREHQAFLWLPLQDAVQRLVWPGQRNALEVVHRLIGGGEEVAGRLGVPPA